MYLKLEDTLWAGLIDQQVKTPMGITAENLAEKYNISRQECDDFALTSQTRWKTGNYYNSNLIQISYLDRLILIILYKLS